MKYLVLLLPLTAFAGFSDLPSETYHYDFKGKKTKNLIKRSYKVRKKNKSSELKNLLGEIKSSDEKISTILESNQKRVIVRKSMDKLKALTRLRGMILNSILATNRKPTTLVIKLHANEHFDEAEVRCFGISFGKRVQGKCDLIVSDKEFDVDAELWDLDGAEGVIADKFYDGSEKEFLTSSFSSFFEGVLDGAKERIITPFGESTTNSSKNKVLSGLVGIARSANSRIKESADKNLQITLINSGREVYVFFNKGVML